MAQIELEQICKTFSISKRPEGRFSLLRGAFVRTRETVRALDSISFSIQEGELVGYIGPNGAGKSTTVKIMSGILTPDSGRCTIMGRTPWTERVAHVSGIGVVFGQRSQLWWDVPVNDSFSLLKDIYRISTRDYNRKLSELTQALDIGSLLKTPVRQLSLGQRMRCEIVAALLHSPRILFLDEPTIGLDAVSKLALRDFLKQENSKNAVTMILTTHDMDDIEALCSRVMVIGHGKLLYNGSLGSLKERYSKLRCIRATLEQYTAAFDVECSERIDVDANTWTVWFDPAKTAAHTMIERLAKALPLRDVIIEEQDIDKIIAAMYKEMCI
ncbi:MAG TPA: ATP-binding cassette domain-containing protein [Clostridia bacterium]|nr:ATP-binding cassette domain-containing protein [Clostridia bacterium]